MKKLVMVSLVLLSFTSCVPLALLGGAAVGAGAAVATYTIKDKIDSKKKANKENKEKQEYIDEVDTVVR